MCIKRREGTECDCNLCSWIMYNIPRWHKARLFWHSTQALPGVLVPRPSLASRLLVGPRHDKLSTLP